MDEKEGSSTYRRIPHSASACWLDGLLVRIQRPRDSKLATARGLAEATALRFARRVRWSLGPFRRASRPVRIDELAARAPGLRIAAGLERNAISGKARPGACWRLDVRCGWRDGPAPAGSSAVMRSTASEASCREFGLLCARDGCPVHGGGVRRQHRRPEYRWGRRSESRTPANFGLSRVVLVGDRGTAHRGETSVKKSSLRGWTGSAVAGHPAHPRAPVEPSSSGAVQLSLFDE